MTRPELPRPTRRFDRLAFTIALAAALSACAGPSAPTDPAPAPDTPSTRRPELAGPGTAAARTSAAAPVTPGTPGTPGTPAGPSAAGTAAAPGAELANAAADADAGSGDGSAGASVEEARPFVADNKVLPPETSKDLQARAAALFEAIVKNEPALGDPFWFPEEPFIPLKDIKDPGKYWKTLHRTYAKDIAKLHRSRDSWDGARFIGFEMGSTPKWVKPGEEANKIGYYRSFRGKLRYEIGGETSSIEVRVMISWQGRWFITHLSKFKK